MLRVASSCAVVAFLAFHATLSSQSYAGTWVMQGSQGPVTLVLNAPGSDRMVRGTISGNGMSFRVQTEILTDRIIGSAQATDGSGAVYFEAMLEGGGLRVLFADVDASGEPVASSAQQFVFQRTSSPASASAPAPAGPAAAPRGNGQAAPAAGGVAGSGPQDRQIADLLTSSPWCTFSYSGSATGSGGTTAQERNVFRADGSGFYQGGSESSYSGRVNDQYGNELARGGTVGSQQSGQPFRWRVDQGVLYVSSDGSQWAPLQLQFSRNSNGYPIITTNGKEYYQCN